MCLDQADGTWKYKIEHLEKISKLCTVKTGYKYCFMTLFSSGVYQIGQHETPTCVVELHKSQCIFQY